MKPTLMIAMLTMAATIFGMTATSAAETSAVHTVKAGESMERIARQNGCSAADLAKANGLKLSAIIQPGQKLKLPAGASAKAPSAAAAPAVNPDLAGKTHTIQKGDTFSSISRKYRISTEALMAANPGVKATFLRPGQTIRLSAPSTESAEIPAPAPVPAPQPTPAAAAASPAVPAAAAAAAAIASIPESKPAAPPAPAAAPAVDPANQDEPQVHSVTIEGEISYGEFAAKHGTNTARLNELNGLDLTNATVLAKGSELYVPAQP